MVDVESRFVEQKMYIVKTDQGVTVGAFKSILDADTVSRFLKGDPGMTLYEKYRAIKALRRVGREA